jgi:hypothetical protein
VRNRSSLTTFIVVVLFILALAGGVAHRAGATSHPAPPPPPPALFAATLSPHSAVRGATQIEAFTLTNTSSPSSGYRLGSADVTIPSGFRVGVAEESWAPFRNRDEGRFGSKDWNASISGGVLHLRAESSGGDRHDPRVDTLLPGQSVTFLLWTLVPCLAPASSTWSTVAGSSITSPGGDFTSSAPLPTLSAGGACSFDVDVKRNQTVGVPIWGTVRALDGHGWPTSAYDGVAAISGTLDNSPSGMAPVYTTALSVIHGGVGSVLATAFDAELSRTLTATAGTITGTSNRFDVLAGATDHLAFIQQPTDVADTSTTIAPAVTVGAYDAGGNLKTAPIPVTLTIGNDPAGGSTLGGTTTETSAAGVATFSDLTVDQPGSGFTLVASSGSIAPATSDPFNVGAPATVCDGTSTCSASNSDGSTSVTTDGVATISFGPVGQVFPDCTSDGQSPARGSIVDIVPGPGYAAENPLALLFSYSRSAVANMDGFEFCISKDGGETYQQVPDCPPPPTNLDVANFGPQFSEQDLPCVGPRNSDNDAGSLNFVLYLTSTDPSAGLH